MPEESKFFVRIIKRYYQELDCWKFDSYKEAQDKFMKEFHKQHDRKYFESDIIFGKEFYWNGEYVWKIYNTLDLNGR